MNQVQVRSTFTHPEIESAITTFQSEAALYELYAKQDAAENKPKEQKYWRNRVYNPVQMKKEELINFLQSLVQPVAATTEAQKIVQHAGQTTTALSAEIKYDETTLLQAETELQKYKDCNTQSYIWIFVVSYLILAGLGDAYLTADALLAGRMSLIAALFIAVPTGAAVGLGAFCSASQYRKAKTPRQKKRILCITIGIAAIFFGLLGYMRAEYYNAAPDINIHTQGEIIHTVRFALEGWQLALISFLLFIGGFYFSVATWISKKKEDLYHYINEFRKKCHSLKETIAAKKRQVQKIEVDKNRALTELTGRCEYALATKKRIHTIAKTHLAKYASINTAHRTDGECPDFLTTISELE